MRLHGGKRGIKPAAIECAHFVEGAGSEHCLEPRIDAAIKHGAVDIEKGFDGAVRLEHRFHAVAMPIGQRAAGCQDHFERAAHARAVVRHEALRAGGIAVAQLGVERRSTVCFEPFPDVRPNLRWNRRNGAEPPRQCLEVKASAADDDRQALGAFDLIERGADIDAPPADGIIFRRIHVAVKHMRHPQLLCCRRSRRDDAQIPIDLHGIGIDDGAAQLLGERKRNGRLAARSRSGDENGVGFAHRP